MPAVGSADRGDRSGVTRGREPAIDRRPDTPTDKRRIAFAAMAGDEQDETVAVGDRALQAAVDRLPCGIEAVSVKIDDPVGLDAAARQAAVPAGIEGDADITIRRIGDRRGRSNQWLSGWLSDWRYKDMRVILVTGKRSDRGRDPSPQGRFVRAERAHAGRWSLG